ncbi:glycosyltransferase [Deinococcus sp.]|uniref:glycosyltransferase n=1 Tax=Deinococcus sp. TaxID=47478 RepID=UPI002869BFBA|nr:glycosyltransferase [Deinococcus sp.]
MRLLYVVTGTNLAGAEMQVLQLSRGMHRRGHEVHVLSLAPEGPVAALAREAGVEVQSLGVRGPAGLIRAVRGVARHTARMRPDVLHSHLIHANLVSRVSRMLGPVPVLISTGHSVREGGSWSLPAYRFTDSLSDLTTNVSRRAVEQYRARRAVPPGKLRFVANGLDLETFDRGADTDSPRRTDGTFRFIAVGRFEEAKDYPTMLRAFALVAAQVPGAHLDIVGEGRGLEAARAQASALNLSGRVTFLGARRDVPALLRSADAFLMSSAWEGMPMVLLEASAARLPVVATDVGSIRDVVQDGRSGYLVPPGDPPALATAALALLSTPDTTRRELGAQGRRHVERTFGLDGVLDEWERIYHELLTARRARQDVRRNA